MHNGLLQRWNHAVCWYMEESRDYNAEQSLSERDIYIQNYLPHKRYKKKLNNKETSKKNWELVFNRKYITKESMAGCGGRIMVEQSSHSGGGYDISLCMHKTLLLSLL